MPQPSNCNHGSHSSQSSPIIQSRRRQVNAGRALPRGQVPVNDATGNGTFADLDSTQSEATLRFQGVDSIEYHHRLLYLLTMLRGLMVVIQLVDGAFYEGVFHQCEGKSWTDLSIVLRMARKRVSELGEAIGDFIPRLLIRSKDFVQLFAPEVDLNFAQHPAPFKDRQDFQTDADISGHRGVVQERTLQKWIPESSSEMSVDWDEDVKGIQSISAGKRKPGSWDQFAANEALFGVQTDFNEEFYTTRLDKSSVDYRKKEKEAELMARQIEQDVSDNVHVTEEHGRVVDDSQMDEEDRYGAVVRGPNAHIPSGRRRLIQNSNKSGPVFRAVGSENGRSIGPALGNAQGVNSNSDSSLENFKIVGSKTSARKSLNPGAAEFKFDASATDFQPMKQSATIMVDVEPSALNVFGTSILKGALDLRWELATNFQHQLRMDDEFQSIEWPFGTHLTYQVIVAAEANESDHQPAHQMPIDFSSHYLPSIPDFSSPYAQVVYPGQFMHGMPYQSPGIMMIPTHTVPYSGYPNGYIMVKPLSPLTQSGHGYVEQQKQNSSTRSSPAS